MEKTIIFCRTYEDTSHIYLYFSAVLQQEVTEPKGYSSFELLICTRTACTTGDVRQFSTPLLRRMVSYGSSFALLLLVSAWTIRASMRHVTHQGPPTCRYRKLHLRGRTCWSGWYNLLCITIIIPKLTLAMIMLKIIL